MQASENQVYLSFYSERSQVSTKSKLVQASESQVYLSFYSECSQVSSPQSGVKDESCESYFDKAASKRVCGSLLTHKASESRFNVVNTGSNRSRVGPLSPYGQLP